MGYLFRLSIVSLVFWVATSVLAQAEQVKSLVPDVRVVIDISGSMKKTDPTNLRKPAVDLIVRLLPDKSKAGIWTFGSSVNMLMPYGDVDTNWRTQAAQTAKAINSIAMHTNIGGALERAVKDGGVNLDGYKRNIVLLTDGVVDVNTEAVVNLAERKRILTEVLPALKAAGYVIHTIALSKNADQELMKKLSVSTDGIFVVAETAEELMSTFLRIFDQAVPAERVPLDENGFLVDASINEFTALIFRMAEVPATVIVAPDGTEFTDTDPQHKVNWYRTANYDLITVQNPLTGQWQVKTKMAPDSRVTVVSNLQLQVEPMAVNLKLKQHLPLEYAFQENGTTITKKEFLSLLTEEVFVSKLGSHESTQVKLDDTETPSDGIFHHVVTGFEEAGSYDVTLMVDGKTFKREFTHHLVVSDSLFRLEKSEATKADKRTFTYKLYADPNFVDIGTTQVLASIKNSKDNNMEKALKIMNEDHWEFSFTPVQTAKYTLSMQAQGKGLDGADFNETIQLDEIYFPDQASLEAELAAAAHKEPPISHDADHDKATSDTEEEHVEEVTEEEAEESSSLWLYVGIGIGNILVFLLAFFAYKMIAGRNSKSELAEIENTLKTVAAKPQKAPANTATAEKTVIDVAENSEGVDLPLGDSADTDKDQMMADSLFPLDNMEESEDKP